MRRDLFLPLLFTAPDSRSCSLRSRAAGPLSLFGVQRIQIRDAMIGARSLRCAATREWRNWQTRRLQVPVSERMWGFKSPLAHSTSSRAGDASCQASESGGVELARTSDDHSPAVARSSSTAANITRRASLGSTTSSRPAPSPSRRPHIPASSSPLVATTITPPPCPMHERPLHRCSTTSRRIDTAEALRWVGRITGDEDHRFERLAALLST